MKAVAVGFSMAWAGAGIEPRSVDQARDLLAAFRRSLHGCFTARADALFELADALLCAEGPVKTLVGLSLAPEHRRGHGALYDAVNHGRAGVSRLRRELPGCRCPAGRMGGSGWGWISARGCGRVRPLARIGCSATSTGAARAGRR